MKQVLRYPGSKARLARWIVEQFPPHECYLEPFAGSAVVLFAKPRSPVEMLNDLDGRVCNFFKVLRDRPEELARAAELTPWARSEYEQSQEDEGDELERARRFLVRCWQGFNGSTSDDGGWLKLCRSAGQTLEFTRWPTLPERIKATAARLRGVQLENRTALEVIRWANDRDALLYCDPPYCTGGSRYLYTMDEEAHESLLDALCDHKGPVFLSAYDSALYESRLKGWHRLSHRRPVLESSVRTEVLWLNPTAARSTSQQRLEI